MEKTVITRKDHKCDACGETIPKGSKATFLSGRGPRYDDEGYDQIGIEYYRSYLHFEPCID